MKTFMIITLTLISLSSFAQSEVGNEEIVESIRDSLLNHRDLDCEFTNGYYHYMRAPGFKASKLMAKVKNAKVEFNKRANTINIEYYRQDGGRRSLYSLITVYLDDNQTSVQGIDEAEYSVIKRIKRIKRINEGTLLEPKFVEVEEVIGGRPIDGGTFSESKCR